MRGTKLTAWRMPPIWNDLQNNSVPVPEGSSVPQKQERLLKATRVVLDSIAEDVRRGLMETVGVMSRLCLDDGLSSVVLALPRGTDTELIAQAIDAENVEAWCDTHGQVHIALNPWYSTKDVDQTVLSTIKIVHVLLGMHASDTPQKKSLKQKILKEISDIVQIRNATKDQ